MDTFLGTRKIRAKFLKIDFLNLLYLYIHNYLSLRLCNPSKLFCTKYTSKHIPLCRRYNRDDGAKGKQQRFLASKVHLKKL